MRFAGAISDGQMPSPWNPHPEYRAKIHSSFARQGLMKHLGGKIRSIEPGQVIIELPHSEPVTQQHGYFHGAAVAAIADTAGGYAALTLMRPDEEIVAAEFKINLLRPAVGALLIATGVVVRFGRSLVVSQATVAEASSGVTVAVMLQTNFRVPDIAEADA
jgi:uncharacterized protein (TIGR00369 family)